MSAPKDILAQLLSTAQAELLDSAGREAWRTASAALGAVLGGEPALSDVDGRLVMPDEIEGEFSADHLVVPIQLATNRDQSAAAYLSLPTEAAAGFFSGAAGSGLAPEAVVTLASSALQQVMQALVALVTGSPVGLTVTMGEIAANAMVAILGGMDEPALCLTASVGSEQKVQLTLVLPGTFLDILAGALPEQFSATPAPRQAAAPSQAATGLPFELTLEEIESAEIVDEMPPVIRTGAFGSRVPESPFSASPFGSNPFATAGPAAGAPGREPTPIAAGAASVAQRAQFAPLADTQTSGPRAGIDLLAGLKMNVAVELGRTELTVADVLGLGPGAVIELDRLAGEPVDILVNETLIARGEVVVVDENFGVRVVEVLRRGIEAEDRLG